MIVDKDKYDGDIYFNETIYNTQINTSLTKVYEYEAPSNGYVDAFIIPIWAAAVPSGSAISGSATCASYETFAASDSGGVACGCSVSALPVVTGQKIHFFCKSTSSTAQGAFGVAIHFHPIG